LVERKCIYRTQVVKNDRLLDQGGPQSKITRKALAILDKVEKTSFGDRKGHGFSVWEIIEAENHTSDN